MALPSDASYLPEAMLPMDSMPSLHPATVLLVTVLSISALVAACGGDDFSDLTQEPSRDRHIPGTIQWPAEYRNGVGQVQARMTLPEDTVIGGRIFPAGSTDERHLFDTDPDFPEYSTVPPTSGPSLSRQFDCGFYEAGYINPVDEQEGVPDRALVHNLKHGNIVISYNLPKGEEVDRLKEVHFSLADSDQWLITRPYKEIGPGKVAMTAWGVLDVFDGVDRARIKAFYDAYRGNIFSEETRRIGRGIPCY